MNNVLKRIIQEIAEQYRYIVVDNVFSLSKEEVVWKNFEKILEEEIE